MACALVRFTLGSVRLCLYSDGSIGELHKLVFRGGPEELLRVRGLHHPGKSLSRADFGPDESLCGPNGLLEDLLHGTDFQPVTPVPGPLGKEFFSWVMFELDGLDEERRKAVEMVCGELTA